MSEKETEKQWRKSMKPKTCFWRRFIKLTNF